MKLNSIFIIVFILMTSFVYSQVSIEDESVNVVSGNDYSGIQIELLAVSYCTSGMFKQNWSGGIEIQGGYGFKISLNTPSYKYANNESLKWAYSSIASLLETIKIKPFISYYISDRTNINLGLYASINKIEYGHPSNYDFAFGVECSVFYGFKKLKIGHRFQFGELFVRYGKSPEANSNVFIILVTPVVFQIKI